ncbi:hypothetical protein SCARR_01029 [Pontiella sulfatireligans]|uniref:Uncharacterized protein n=1 Tax=Pontiella sulfatireligans TaxID=2750658 RepID=A0A6C2UFQ1_9BACT|nr:hypothetical protein SCARR_01029 [Pontiella sulfatireligans]
MKKTKVTQRVKIKIKRKHHIYWVNHRFIHFYCVL